jgi:hypothetical protein
MKDDSATILCDKSNINTPLCLPDAAHASSYLFITEGKDFNIPAVTGNEAVQQSEHQTLNNDESLKRPSCRRNLAKELEKELTFRPELNQKSMKIASRSTRQCVPLVCRLTERRKKLEQRSFSFAPSINPHSVKLAQERAEKIDEVKNRDISGNEILWPILKEMWHILIHKTPH